MPDGFTISEKPPAEADAKRPLFRGLPPAPAFPIEATGALRPAVEAIHARTQAPLALCAQSVLAATTLAIQHQRNVELPGGGTKPLTGLFASIAESGERKTTVDRIALAAAYRLEERLREERDAALTAFLNDKTAWDEARKSAIRKCKGDRGGIRDALDRIGPEPMPPPAPMLLVSDPTPEALILHLRDARPWAGVFTAEGGMLLGGSAFNDESRMRTGALLNTLWDGEPIRRARVLTGDAFLQGRRCSAHIMMQSVVAHRLFGDAMLDGIGLLARFLVVAPESTAGTRLFREAPAECAAVLSSHNGRLAMLLARPPVLADGTTDVLAPPAMTLSEHARSVWIRFHDAVEHDLADAGELRPIRAFGAKLAEHAGRLAAVLAAYADPDTMTVGIEAIECGIDLARHYAAEMLRLAGAAAVAPELTLAARLLVWWQARPDPRVHLVAIYQTGPAPLRDAASARPVLTVLEDHGWIRRLPTGTELDGAKRREAWELVP